MAKKKRENQSRIVDTIISIFFALVIGYGVITGLQTIGSDINYIENLFIFKNKISWIMEQEAVYQAPVLIMTIGMFVLMATMTRKKPSGYKDASAHGAYGNAVFSDPSDVREDKFIAARKESKWSEKDPLKTLECSEGIILGRSGDELVIIPPNSKLDNRNVQVVGSSGSAKGQAFVINNILNNKSQTLIVTDPKGELFDQTSDIKRDQGYRVYQIDFLNLKGSRYNPLDYVKNDIEAIKLANAISINSAKDVKQDFFFNTARDLLTGLIIYAKSEYDNPNISKTVKGIFNNITSDEEFLPELCERIGDEHPAYQYLKDASAQTGNTRASILSSFAQQTGVFSLSDVSKLTEKSDFDFHEFQEHKSILYVKIPVKNNPVPALTATFFDQLISTLYQIGDENGAKLKIPTIFLLDEFANLGKLNDYDNTLSTCRGYDLSIITIVQDFAQLEEKYSKELARTIINNHDTTLFLRTKDTETAKYFERLAGDTTVNYKTNSTSNSGGLLYILGAGSSNPSKSVNEQYIKKPLVSESELLNMNPTDKCYVFMTGHVLELKKAYQSVIYKGFITGEKMEKVNGILKYPYTYPKNREAYIKKFKLEPYKNEVIGEKEIKKPIPIVKNPNPIKEEVVEQTDDKREEAIQSIVNNFFDDIQKKNSIKQSDETEETSQSDSDNSDAVANEDAGSSSTTGGNTTPSKDDTQLAQVLVEEINESEDIISDPNSLSVLQQAALLPARIEESNVKSEGVIDLRSLIGNLGLSEQAKNPSPTPENKVDEIDELPLG